MKSAWLWFLLYAVAVIPPAIFGAYVAGSSVDRYDAAHRPRLSPQIYRTTHDGWEMIGGIIGGVPGFLLVGRSQLRQEKERREAMMQRAADEEDQTVWPPPPRL